MADQRSVGLKICSSKEAAAFASCLGVAPVRSTHSRTMWAWSANPTAVATSIAGSPASKRRRVSSNRSRRATGLGVSPISVRKASPRRRRVQPSCRVRVADADGTVRTGELLPRPADLVARRFSGAMSREEERVDQGESCIPALSFGELFDEFSDARAEQVAKFKGLSRQEMHGDAKESPRAERREIDLDAALASAAANDRGLIGEPGYECSVARGGSVVDRSDPVGRIEGDDDRDGGSGELLAGGTGSRIRSEADVTDDSRLHAAVRRSCPRGPVAVGSVSLSSRDWRACWRHDGVPRSATVEVSVVRC